jgi:hypothetical protein
MYLQPELLLCASYFYPTILFDPLKSEVRLFFSFNINLVVLSGTVLV